MPIATKYTRLQFPLDLFFSDLALFDKRLHTKDDESDCKAL